MREVEDIDLKNQVVTTSPGFRPRQLRLQYDHLVIALGSVSNFSSTTCARAGNIAPIANMSPPIAVVQSARILDLYPFSFRKGLVLRALDIDLRPPFNIEY